MRARILMVHARKPDVLPGMAQTLAEVFENLGVEVAVRAHNEVESVEAFDSAVILGFLETRGWRDGTLEFFHRHRPALAHLTVAYALALGPGLDPANDLPGVERALQRTLDWFNELRPVKMGLFHMARPGALDEVRAWGETLKPNFVGPSLESPSGLRDFLGKWPHGRGVDRMPSRDTRGWPR